MKEKNYNYVYAVVNFAQRLAYIGSRGSNKPPLEDPYMGSFKKGLEFFPDKKIILSEHVTRKEAYEAEREWQFKYDVAKSLLFVNRGILTSSGFSNAGKVGGIGSMRGKKHTLKTKTQIRKKLQHRFKNICIKNINTNEVFKFDSIGLASRELGISTAQLSFLLKGKYKRTHNYCLETTDTNCFKVKFILKNANTGKLIEATSQAELAQKIGANSGEVCRIFNGSRLSTKGYCLPETDIKLLGIKKRTVKLFNTLTKKIEEFNGVLEAAEKIGVSHSLVSMVLKGTRRRAKQYVLPPEEKTVLQ
jgi:hypothetical protein